MNTIGNNQGILPTGPGVLVQEQNTQAAPNPAPADPGETAIRDNQAADKVQPAPPRPKEGQQYLDPDQMKEFVAQVSAAIREASVEPHVVGFRPDPESRGYLIEIRRPDGTLVTTFAPEKVLNLGSLPDDLSGMVIDRKS